MTSFGGYRSLTGGEWRDEKKKHLGGGEWGGGPRGGGRALARGRDEIRNKRGGHDRRDARAAADGAGTRGGDRELAGAGDPSRVRRRDGRASRDGRRGGARRRGRDRHHPSAGRAGPAQ